MGCFSDRASPRSTGKLAGRASSWPTKELERDGMRGWWWRSTVTLDPVKREGGRGDSAGREEVSSAIGVELGHAARATERRRGDHDSTPLPTSGDGSGFPRRHTPPVSRARGRPALLEDGEQQPAANLHPRASSVARWRGVEEEAKDTSEKPRTHLRDCTSRTERRRLKL
jgi:hypothetical protein